MTNLFEAAGLEKGAPRPLADRLRPRTLFEVTGQDHLVGPDGKLTRLLQGGRLPSLILWGPPGCGKTTIARLLAGETNLAFEQLSAIFSGVQDLRKAFDKARMNREQGRGTLLFIDEIHRFNRSQQDSFLPHMEDGTITLVGATTENPSFELNAALLSRAIVLTLNRLDDTALDRLLARAEAEMQRKLPLDADAREGLVQMADGDGRAILNLAEDVFATVADGATPIGREELVRIVQRRAPIYDKSREGHYNLVSALHKSVRGSGLADPQALVVANAAKDAYDFLGSPEGELALSEAVIYLATAPKSNANYVAYKAAMRAAREQGSLSPPKIILNAPTKFMEEEGYGEGYQYDHDAPDGFSGQNYFPDEMKRRPQYYDPPERGFEREIRKRLDYWAALRRKRG